jgi:hypothetical protein
MKALILTTAVFSGMVVFAWGISNTIQSSSDTSDLPRLVDNEPLTPESHARMLAYRAANYPELEPLVGVWIDSRSKAIRPPAPPTFKEVRVITPDTGTIEYDVWEVTMRQAAQIAKNNNPGEKIPDDLCPRIEPRPAFGSPKRQAVGWVLELTTPFRDKPTMTWRRN